ncbi:VapE domain-containing protein [Paracoccus sp. SSK6]|uniref:VapE domain-containing protein n=1 Tax=Paracoccus sp. SSK6 TaxID=3143131 RepID=UPI00321B0D16
MQDDKHMPDAAVTFAADLDAQIAEMDAPDDDLSEYVAVQEWEDYHPPVTIRVSENMLDEAAEQEDEINADLDLRAQLQRREDSKGAFLGYKPTLHNVRKILALDPKIGGALAYNEMTCTPVLTRGVELAEDLAPMILEDGEYLLLADHHAEDIRSWLSDPEPTGGWGINMRLDDVRQSISSVARRRSFHSIKELYEAEPWDGVARLDTFFIRHFKTPDNIYHREVARIFLLAMCARIYVPGYDYQYMLVIQGKTGSRKSTALKKIAGEQHHTEVEASSMKDIKTKTEALVGSHIVEMPELTALLAMPFDEAKILISQGKAKVRLAFEKSTSIRKLSSVLAGTTEKQAYLRDPLGNRRYLPVIIDPSFSEFNPIDTDALEAEMPQVRAEALVRFRQLWADGVRNLTLSDEAKVIQRRLTALASMETEADAIHGQIEAFLMSPWDSISAAEATNSDFFMAHEGKIYRTMWCREMLVDMLEHAGYNVNSLRDSKAKGNDIASALEKIEWIKADGNKATIPWTRTLGRQRRLVVDREGLIAALRRRDAGDDDEETLDAAEVLDHPEELQFG